MPAVMIIGTGGTIAGEGAHRDRFSDYEPGVLSGDELVAAVPEIATYAEVTTEQLLNVASHDLAITDWLQLASRINQVFATTPELAGIVVTHGTNVLEETAYFLNLVVNDPRPVVLVGAQRPATALSSDGPINLLNAVRVAADPQARSKGVLIVMNNEIGSARDSTKTHTSHTQAFRAPDHGVLGYVDDDAIDFYMAPTRRHTKASEFDTTGLSALPKVEILYTYADQDPRTVDDMARRSTEGIVVAGLGSGAVSERLTEHLDKLAGRITVVHASRVAAGRVVSRGKADDRIRADNLNPQKSRVLLMLALTRTREASRIQSMFDEY